MPSKRICAFCKTDGTTCRATAQATSDYCFFHDPEKAVQRKEARKRGGKRNRQAAVQPLPGAAEDLPLASVADVVALLAQTVNQVRKGQMDAKTGNCLAVLSGCLLRALEGNELAKQIEELRRRLDERDAHAGDTETTSNGPASPTEAATDGDADASGAYPTPTDADPGSNGDDGRSVAGEVAASELEEGVAPMQPTVRQKPGSRGAGAG